jgi:hypothetical protein
VIAFRHDFAVHGDIADGLLKIMAGRIGELLEVFIGPPQFLLLLFCS